LYVLFSEVSLSINFSGQNFTHIYLSICATYATYLSLLDITLTIFCKGTSSALDTDAPASLATGKDPQLLIGYEAGWVLDLLWLQWQ